MFLLLLCCTVVFFFEWYGDHRYLHVLTHAFPTRRSSDLSRIQVELRQHARLRLRAYLGHSGCDPREQWRAVQRKRGQGRAFHRTGAAAPHPPALPPEHRSEEHTSELQSLMRISYAVSCLKIITKISPYHYPTTHLT